MDPYKVEAYVRLLRGETREGTISMEQLVRLGYQRGAQPALICLSDQKMEARVAAVRVLGLMGDARAVEPLLGCLQDQSPGVREAAALALGQVRDPRATLPLVGCLEDRSRRVRAEVFMALAKLRDPRATLPLVACLKDQPSKMRHVAIEALGRLGDDRAAETLMVHLADSNRLVRDAAAEALRRLGYRPVTSGPVPWDTDELEQLARKPAIPPHLRWQPDQTALTPEQQAEAGRFPSERIETQLDTSRVDEPEAEALLKRVYGVAGLIPPRRIRWVDSPLQLVVALALDGEPGVRQIAWGMRKWVLAGSSAGYTVVSPLTADVEHKQIAARVKEHVWTRVGSLVGECVQAEVQASIEELLKRPLRRRVRERVPRRVEECVGASVEGYRVAPLLASYHFHGHYQSSTRLHVLAHFNELVSGYWLGREQAVLVRRPKVLARDAQGWLHSATGKCIEYRDGWGFYAWHGVRVPEQVILTPEALSREDALNAPDLRVRRVMQERMGERFASEP